MRKLTSILLVILTLSLVAADAAGGESFLLAGNSRTLWMVIQQDATTYSLAFRQPQSQWEGPTGESVGAPVAAAAVGEWVQVFFADGQSMKYSTGMSQIGGLRPPTELWPPGSRLLGVGEAQYDHPETLLALIQRPATTTRPAGNVITTTCTAAAGAGLPSAATATAEGAEPTTTPASATQTIITAAPGPVRELALLRYARDKWEQVAVLPVRPQQDISRAYISTVKDAYCLLLVGEPSPTLWVLQSNNWEQVAYPAGLEGCRPIGLETVHEPVLAVYRPSDQRVLITRLSPWPTSSAASRPVARTWSQPQPLFLPGQQDQASQPTTWPADAPPAVSRLGDQLALVWKVKDGYQYALAAPTGSLTQPASLGLANKQAQEEAEQVRNMFVYFVGGLIVVLLFWPGQRPRTAPFSLPPHMVPAGLAKRFLAFLIDAVPFLVVSFVIAGHSTEEMQAIADAAKDGKMPPPWVMYTSITFLASYAGYCTICELLFKATVGKRILRLKVVGDGGLPPTPREVVLRNAFKIVEFLLAFLIIPLLLPLLSPYRQRLGDRFAWTAVIDTSIVMPPSGVQGPAPREPEDKDSDEPDS